MDADEKVVECFLTRRAAANVDLRCDGDAIWINEHLVAVWQDEQICLCLHPEPVLLKPSEQALTKVILWNIEKRRLCRRWLHNLPDAANAGQGKKSKTMELAGSATHD